MRTKITLATIKSFIAKNNGNLYIRNISDFDAMTDGAAYSAHPQWQKTEPEEPHMHANSLGIKGAWFVFQSRDSFQEIKEPGFTGYHIYNSCGSFDLAAKVQP